MESLITIDCASSGNLIEQVPSGIIVADELKRWKFSGTADGGESRRYQVLTYRLEQNMSFSQAEHYFASQGAVGNVAAFIAWIIEAGRSVTGTYVSIPPIDDRYVDPQTRENGASLVGPGVPRFMALTGWRSLNVASYEQGATLSKGTTLVAFREVP